MGKREPEAHRNRWRPRESTEEPVRAEYKREHRRFRKNRGRAGAVTQGEWRGRRERKLRGSSGFGVGRLNQAGVEVRARVE